MSEIQVKKIDHLDHAPFDPSLDTLPPSSAEPALSARSIDIELARIPEDKKKHCPPPPPQIWLWWTIAANLFTAVMYFLIFYQAAFAMSQTEEHQDVTIYTQAIEDWNAKAWTDFGWYKDGNCPEGYEPIGAYWQGTNEGTITKDCFNDYCDELDVEKVEG